MSTVKEDLDSIGKRLRFARKARGLTQDALEKRSGIKQSDISKIERGSTEKPAGLLALARAVRCNPDWLDTGNGDWQEAIPSDVGAALSLISDLLQQRSGVQRATAISALQYFLDKPDEWQQVAAQLDSLPPQGQSLGEPPPPSPSVTPAPKAA